MNGVERERVSLGNAEKDAVSKLAPELEKHLLLSERVFNFSGKVLESMPNAPVSDICQSRKVCSFLLSRLANDLRCSALLAVRGYSMQACSLIASVYEAAFTIAAIDSDENLAQRWIDHTDPNRSFRSVKKITEIGLVKLGVPDAATHARRRYLIYRQLCMPKHLNPVYQQTRGFEISETKVIVRSGPDTSEDGARDAWFALEHGSGLTFIAATSVIQHHVPQEEHPKLVAELREIEKELLTLNSMAVARWGTTNPFPNHWKV